MIVKVCYYNGDTLTMTLEEYNQQDMSNIMCIEVV